MTGNPQINTTLERIFETLTEIPTFPKVAQKALALLDDPEIPLTKVVDVLRYDQALTANILRLANSAHFALPQQVGNVETAVALLGEKHVRQVLVASASLPYLTRPLGGYGLSPAELWTHSIGTAVIGEAMASRFRFIDSSLLFTAALLHDIGKVVLNLFVGMHLPEIQALAESEQSTFMDAEWRILGADHAIVGRELLRQWQFPPELIRAIRNHHDPDLYVQDDLSALLALSNILATLLGLGVGSDSFRYRIPARLVDRLGLDRESAEACMAEALHAFYRTSDLLSLQEIN